ncbi:hypothetical protein Tco_0906784, partial [Tanacetum coccineum]
KMDDPNITMEEYIRLEEEKARRHGRTFNWQTATFGKVKNYEDEDDHPIDFKIEFPVIVFDNTTAIQSEPTVCPPNGNELDFRISLDESDAEDYTDLENEFPAIVYNDGLTSKSDLGIKPLINSEYMEPLPAADQRHPWLRYQIEEYTEEIRRTEMRQDLAVRLRMVYSGEGQQVGRRSPEESRARAVIEGTIYWAIMAMQFGLHLPQALPDHPPTATFTMYRGLKRLEEEVHDLRRDVVGLRGNVTSFTTEQSRVSTWLISCMTQLMDAGGQTYRPFNSTLVGSSG